MSVSWIRDDVWDRQPTGYYGKIPLWEISVDGSNWHMIVDRNGNEYYRRIAVSYYPAKEVVLMPCKGGKKKGGKKGK
jgi:hypothetical protein